MSEPTTTGFRPQGARHDGDGPYVPHVEDLYQSWFLEYASYVILDRAVPDIRDGLKPVQRRLLHALSELDDGRLNKAANVIGHTMRYHPHGDMAIEDALVKLAQKDLLIDMQGNWGNLFTGDRAAAPRYIECRLGKLSKEILFHEELTEWQSSYDGRNKEPISLPVKFPLLLALGVEGIAVGLSTKILPHNFSELCDASMAFLEGKPFTLFPDFPAGGIADFSQYREGQRGGRIRVRARIHVLDSKTLQIVDLPFGTNTGSLIDSILSANDKNKIKIKRVEDNTGKEVDIRILLPAGVSAEQTLEALYAFTDCEISIATHACVIRDQKPFFCSTTDLLVDACERTRDILRRELELEIQKFEQKIRKSTLEQLFIEHKVYRKLEGAESFEDAREKLQKAFKPLLQDLKWTLNEQDLEILLDIRFKRLTRYDSSQADAQLETLRKELLATQKKLSQLTAYTIEHFRTLKKNFGKVKRQTTIAQFGEINAREVVHANLKLYVNRAEGFLGTGLKKDEFIGDCSELDQVLVIRRSAQASLVKVSDKCFVGEDIFYLALLPSAGSDSILHLLFRDQETGDLWMKRQRLGPMQKDKVYDLLKAPGEILYASIFGEPSADWLELDRGKGRPVWAFNFADFESQPRTHRGHKLSQHVIEGVRHHGVAGPDQQELTIFLDKNGLGFGSAISKGQKLGQVKASALLYTFSRDGEMRVFPACESQKLSAPMIAWGVFHPDQVFTAVFGRSKPEVYGIRRWKAEDFADGSLVQVFHKKEGDQIFWFSAQEKPLLRLKFAAHSGNAAAPPELVSIGDCVPVKGLKASAWKLQRQAVLSWEEVQTIN